MAINGGRAGPQLGVVGQFRCIRCLGLDSGQLSPSPKLGMDRLGPPRAARRSLRRFDASIGNKSRRDFYRSAIARRLGIDLS